MTPYKRLLLPENIYYAWRKAKRLYRMDDGHINQGELLEFELDLENRLHRIEQQFIKGKYKLQPLRPLPRPKKLKDDQYVDRQYYHVAVDDQVAWIAIANALGPEIDNKMPAWSYGNRLYRPAWYEEETSESKLEIGPYRHASGHFYKKFQHSWPLFRKHISLTARTMVRPIIKAEETEPDQRAIEAAISEGLPYLKKDFWNRPQKKDTDLYHASIDLKQFYPNISAEKILAGLFLAESTAVPEEKLHSLLKDMLDFRLDKSDVPEPYQKNVEPKFGGKHIKGLPTGLYVAGFLANVAMLPVDIIVNEKVQTESSIAHFRFVDDHVFIAYSFDILKNWISWYSKLVVEEVGVNVNNEKYDPEALSKCLNPKLKSETRRKKLEKEAEQETKIDGLNPTKLLTKTLEKVSIIAGQNANILDDNDLEDRLKDLEWLLLADIPEREIRPDTRAAFAAGQIASLVPLLVQDEDGIVDSNREFLEIQSELKALKEFPEANNKNIEKLEEKKKLYEEKLKNQIKALKSSERGHLTRYFGLLLHAMKEHPGKARLFFRLHQYCLLTGHQGLKQIEEWIEGLRVQGATVWADYYYSLTLQTLAKNILKALQVLTKPSCLRSDQNAAINHLEDIGSFNQNIFKESDRNKAWFHKVAEHEFAVSVSIAAEYLKQKDLLALASKFIKIAKLYNSPAIYNDSSVWIERTGRASGNWAFLAEHYLSLDSRPTNLWSIFERGFDYANSSDQRAIRLYPEAITDRAWKYFSTANSAMKEDDSGWVYEILRSKPDWVNGAKKIPNSAFSRAAQVVEANIETHISVADWTEYIRSNECTSFDPRRSEWTALEIVKRIVELSLRLNTNASLENTHPQNILIPKEWKELLQDENVSYLSWEIWRSHISVYGNIEFTEPQSSLLDYRYHNKDHADIWTKREGQFISIGRLLLGILSGKHNAPIIWNIRGNEQVVDIPRAHIFRSLAISSPTLLLIEGCIDPRSAESRLITRLPDLFGWIDGSEVNDTRYDPPLLKDTNGLLNAIRNAQKILENNQLAVSMHQPRQLIPFRLSDFDVSKSGESEEILDDE